MEKEVEFLVEGVVMLTIAIIGLVLNITSIFYFARYNHQRAFHRLLMTLAIVDSSYLIFSSLSFSIKHLSQEYANTAWKFLVPYTLPIAQTSMMASVYLTISLTIERYFSVVKPFYQLRNRWLRSSLVLAMPGLLFSMLFTLPNYFMIRTEWVNEPVLALLPENFTYPKEYSPDMWTEGSFYLNITNQHGKVLRLAKQEDKIYLVRGFQTTPDIQFAQFRNNEVFIQVYVMWLHLIFVSILPLSLLFTLNFAIYKKLSSLPDQLRRSTEGTLRRRELRFARISLLIVFIFMLCHTPKIIPSTFEILGYDPSHIPILVQISHLLLTLNCSVNFLVYYLATGRHVRNLFCRKANRNRQVNEGPRELYHSVAIFRSSNNEVSCISRGSTMGHDRLRHQSTRSQSTRYSFISDMGITTTPNNNNGGHTTMNTLSVKTGNHFNSLGPSSTTNHGQQQQNQHIRELSFSSSVSNSSAGSCRSTAAASVHHLGSGRDGRPPGRLGTFSNANFAAARPTGGGRFTPSPEDQGLAGKNPVRAAFGRVSAGDSSPKFCSVTAIVSANHNGSIGSAMNSSVSSEASVRDTVPLESVGGSSADLDKRSCSSSTSKVSFKNVPKSSSQASLQTAEDSV